ncbi:Sedoheptulokinase [Phytophthora palmivora]|uniref:Sedoheptulokinase n=1 Tax=Phytophthora palmivora TaxID=4796 RepID=A0A2P4YF96_9STRA|nr:Sedoheptulokinase [Phytophthora palmivora]
MVPLAHGLLTSMQDMRRDENLLRTKMMLEYIKTNHSSWFNNYVAGKKRISSTDNAIMQLLQHFCKRQFFICLLYSIIRLC